MSESTKKKEAPEKAKGQQNRDASEEAMIASAYAPRKNGEYVPDEHRPSPTDRPPTVEGAKEFLLHDHNLEVISRQGVDGHVLEVSNIGVNDAAGWLERVNAGEIHGRLSQDDIASLEGQYIMTAIVDGKTVYKHISEKEYDKFLALDNYHRFRYFNHIMGIEEGNSRQVENIEDNHTHQRDIALDAEASRQAVMAIVEQQDWYQRAKANGTELSIEPKTIGQDVGFDGVEGSYVLTVRANRHEQVILLSEEDYDRLRQFTEGNAMQAKPQANYAEMSTMAFEQQMSRYENAEEISAGMHR